MPAKKVTLHFRHLSLRTSGELITLTAEQPRREPAMLQVGNLNEVRASLHGAVHAYRGLGLEVEAVIHCGAEAVRDDGYVLGAWAFLLEAWLTARNIAVRVEADM